MKNENEKINTAPTEHAAAPKPSEKQSTLIDPAKVPGNYAIITESGNQRRIFGVFNGTVRIVSVSALGGAFELK